jgi:hypothetical protein
MGKDAVDLRPVRRVRVSIDHALVAACRARLAAEPRATVRFGASVRRGGDELELIVPRLDGAEAGAPVVARIFAPAAAAKRADIAYWRVYESRSYAERPTLDLGLEPDGGVIAAFLSGRDRIAVDEVLIVGPKYARLVPARGPVVTGAPLASDAPFSRLAGALGGADALKRLQSTTFVVIGCARLGSLVVVGLARMGVKKIALVDGDVLESHSVDAMEVRSTRDVGKPKVHAVAAMVHAIAPDVDIEPIVAPVESGRALEAVVAADVVITAPDSDHARLVASSGALSMARPHIDVGAGVFGSGADWVAGADVRFCMPRERCLMCLGGLDLRERPPAVWSATRAGSLRELNQLAVSQALLLLQRFVVGDVQQSTWRRLRVARDGTLGATAMTGAPTVPCAFCRRLSGIGDGLFDLDLVRGLAS